ncbi:hypothetical protein VTJ83DRAFT_3800 [Remersonia thermophila]|uniref:AA1-like domain-containing protein n=1 Tax=Remersonia thermophila TaxID=72144 RepID=A0ABR4DFY3_9PEZI
MYLHLSLAALLLGLAAASPVAAPAPISVSPAGCADNSFKNFSWQAQNFDFQASYIFTTPSHQNSWGYVSFDLFNPAVQKTTRCEAASNQLSDFFYGTVQYKCNDTALIRETSFDFNRPLNQLRVKQRWTCDDRNPMYPITINAQGNVNLTLSCTDNTWKNPSWQIGQIYSSRTIQCQPVNSPILPQEMSAVM